MNRKHRGLLSLPAGSEGIFLHDAELQRRMVRALDELYDTWAYTPVHTPMVDYADAYAESVGINVPDHTYRLVDREGQVLSLRSDITLFLIKQIHRLLRGAELPLRLCYSDSILRYQDEAAFGRNEFFQTGVELLGSGEREGDLEILFLLAETLKVLDLPEAAIHLGHREIFDRLYPDLPPARAEEYRRAIALRNWELLEPPQVDTSLNPREVFGRLQDINDLDAGELRQNLPEVLHKVLDGLLDSLYTLKRTLKDIFPELKIRLDLSETGSQAYHSGLVFSAYCDGLDSPIATGGRYDRLLGRSGEDIEAIGFSVMLSKLVAMPGAYKKIKVQKVMPAPGGSIEDRYLKARPLRAKGQRLAL